MRLQSIQVKGFKSFAETTDIHFYEDVTGIVGPNGAGKSNVVDAIRWVLGEMKSRELRLEKMGDIIFNGTKKRKKAGAASVTLTFRNDRGLIPSEYDVVSISRHLYQSGDSEYRLNDVVCRRKDIMNLFIDTGIGSNSYAIIGQGMVTEIIDDRDGARRKMFEQAAGISKYKVRKRETLNKLASTEADLARVEDLLFELERNLKDLERQAKRAQKYKDLKAAYRTESISLAAISTKTYTGAYESLKQKLKDEKDRVGEMRAAYHSAEAKLEEIKRQNVDIEQEVSSSQRKMNELLDGLRQMESSKEIKSQRLEFLRSDLLRLDAQMQTTDERQKQVIEDLRVLDGQRVTVQKEKEDAQEIHEKAQSRYDGLKAQHETAKADLSNFMSLKQGLDNAVFDLEKGYAVNINKIDSNKLALEKIMANLDSQTGEANNLKREVADINQKRELLKRDISVLTESESNRQSSIESLKAKIEEIRVQISDFQRDVDRKSNEFRLIKSMVDNLEGYPESVRFLSQSTESKKVLLSDVIDTPKKYRLSIESFLDPYLNHFIAKDIKEAMGMLSLLSQAQKGKAQFFILNEFDVSGAHRLPTPEGCVRALEVVADAGEYQPLLNDILKNVFITDDREAVESYQGEGAILLMNGGLVRRKSQVKGGSVGLFEGKKLGRKKEMQNLEKEIESLEKQILKLGQVKEKAEKELREWQEKDKSHLLKSRTEELAGLENTHVSLATKLEGLEAALVANSDTRRQLRDESELLKAQNQDIITTLEKKKVELVDLESRISDRGGEVDQWIGQLSLASEALNKASRTFLELQNKESNLVQRIDFLNDQYRSNEQSIKEGEARKERGTQEMGRLTEELSEIESKLVREYEQRGDQQAKLNDVEKVYYAGRNEIFSLEEGVRKLNRSLMQQQDLVESLSQKYTDLRIQLRSITDRMEVEFGVSMEEILSISQQVEDSMEDIQERVDRLKRRLENFGEINPMALEAYDEMKIRYDSIQSQRADILDARTSLESTIKEIETKATEQFLAAFENVKTHFKEVFRSLFTEDDDCDLILSDPENPLDSFIEVIARPKGKRPRTLSQLSGGEKALTAIALLFSLYLLKPAPFCVFDEVDAPLDDVNVIKFNKIIRRFSDRSQFIVITHNKLTMAEVDVLYGIYMEEQGISNVSQVDFRNYEHELVLERT